jgi:hypothetical protein
VRGDSCSVALPPSVSATESHDLIRKLIRGGVAEKDATAKVDAFCKYVNTLLVGEKAGAVKDVGGKVTKSISPSSGTITGKVKLQFKEVTMEINIDHYEKLERLYNVYSEMNKGQDLDSAIFKALCRYSTVQGTIDRNGGMQAAIHETVFVVLKQEFGVTLECFASPFNCIFKSYCSAFLDTDAPFGSLGSFFRFTPDEGSFEANPPFDPDLIERMYLHMSKLLAATSKPLSFVVIIPFWPGKACHEHLLSSEYQRRHLQIAASEHGFFEGSQHIRDNVYRLSNSDTSVFFLQNGAGSEKWKVTDDRVSKLLVAFKPKHKSNPPASCAPSASGSKKRKFSEK